jgi:hypothetical protein
MSSSHVQFDDWNAVSEWCDELICLKPSYVDKINSRLYPKDAFTMGQMVSKAWMVNVLSALKLPPADVIAIIGCWIGSAVPHLNQFATQRIYGIDCDAHSVELSEQFNQQLVQAGWRYKGVVLDIDHQQSNDLQFETGGELIDVKPDWIINTSSEHMSSHWFDTADSDQLIIMQTNNSAQYDGHINICDSTQHMKDKYPLSKTLYEGSVTTPAYIRYMQIGHK